MLKNVMMIAVIGALATNAFATPQTARSEAKEVVEVKDGTTLYVFKDGKMAMESPYGRPVRMALGQVMEAKDGRKITMDSDEVMRLDLLFKAGTTTSTNPYR